MAQLAINSREAASTGLSPFFLEHGYHFEPLDLHEPAKIALARVQRTQRERASQIADKMAESLDSARVELSDAQQQQEAYTNTRRDAAPDNRVGQKVWLDIRDVRSDRLSHKLGPQHAKFTITKKINANAYRLDTPPGSHSVFHVWRLRPAADDPFPSQKESDYQPPGVLVNDEEEHFVEQIIDEKVRRRGKGTEKQFLVKFIGFQTPEWRPAKELENNTALDIYEQTTRGTRGMGERRA